MAEDKNLTIKVPPFEEIVKDRFFQMHVAAMEEYAISETYDALDEYKAINASILNERKDSAGVKAAGICDECDI